MRRLTLVLQGQPLAKQSVRKGRNIHTGKDIYYQPKKTKKRMQDYKYQINSQLPKDFEMYTEKVYIEKMEFMFEPLAAHKKVKYKMNHIKAGGTFEKTTKPDLSDNLKKLVLDSMSDLVFKDDALICRENNVTKCYGSEGKITIVLSGE